MKNKLFLIFSLPILVQSVCLDVPTLPITDTPNGLFLKKCIYLLKFVSILNSPNTHKFLTKKIMNSQKLSLRLAFVSMTGLVQ